MSSEVQSMLDFNFYSRPASAVTRLKSMAGKVVHFPTFECGILAWERIQDLGTHPDVYTQPE